MRTTNFLKAIVVAIFFAFALPNSSSAISANIIHKTVVDDSTAKKEALAKIVVRLNEIQSMDKSSLSTAEKRTLRKELKEMKKEAERDGGGNGGIYLSVGGIIIVILLLILLLK